MPEYGFTLTRILPYKDRIADSVTGGYGSVKPTFPHILCIVTYDI